jgi:hypothetical protein
MVDRFKENEMMMAMAMMMMMMMMIMMPMVMMMATKTMMKMNGKRMLKTIADGLLKMERRLALAMAIIALY